MRHDNSNETTTQQAEKFDEFTGGYDDVDHERAAAKIRAEARAMDATPRAGQHTPGPWHMAKKPYSRSKDCPSGWNVRADTAMPSDPPEHVVATAHGTDVYGFSAEANARLVAAAPDLLELCQTILTRLDMEPKNAVFPCSAMREDIRAAIARATR